MKTESAFYAITLLGFLMKVMGIAGSGALLILALGSLAMLNHLPGIYFFSVGKISNQKWPITVAAILFFSLVPLACLFRIMQWEGASSMLYMGNAGILLVGFLTLYYRKKPSLVLPAFFTNMLIRCGLLMGLTLLTFL
jgi:hypothetical protein